VRVRSVVCRRFGALTLAARLATGVEAPQLPTMSAVSTGRLARPVESVTTRRAR
jgi:hypothetical protein